MSEPAERPYQPIEAYALIGNCEGCALVARDGSIDWACLDRFDAPPAFSRLLDRQRGGHFSIRPEGRYETTRQYLSRSNILETTFTTQDGFVTLHDFMVGPEGAQQSGSDRPRLVRLVSGVSGRVPMMVTYRPLPGFAEAFAPPEIAGGRVSTPGCPSLVSEVTLMRDGAGASARFILEGGEARSFSLYAGALPETLPDARALMEQTCSAWVLWTKSA